MSFNSKYTGAQVEAWLDNIKNYSANDILEKLKTVDGSSSGLDADLLDGKHLSDILASNVASATKLATPKTIWGQSFDGTADITGNMSGVSNITMSGDIFMSNNMGIGMKTKAGSNRYVMLIGTDDILRIGGGAATAGLNTYLLGNNIQFRYGKSQAFGMVLTDAGYFGVNVESPAYRVDVGGDIHTSGTLTQDSDIRLKNINKDILLSIEDIANAPLFEFTYKNDEHKRIHVGTSAQYWVERNNWFCKKQNNGYYDMEIQNLALASAISIAKEFKKYKEETESTISSMKKEIEELKQLILNMNK